MRRLGDDYRLILQKGSDLYLKDRFRCLSVRTSFRVRKIGTWRKVYFRMDLKILCFNIKKSNFNHVSWTPRVRLRSTPLRQTIDCLRVYILYPTTENCFVSYLKTVRITKNF